MRQAFRPGGWQTVLVLLSAPTLLWLGFWQLERADMKETRLAEFAERAAAPPLQLADLAPDDRADLLYWRRARGTGEYRPPLILLDNRIRYAHFIWHLFVLGGSACHFFAALWYGVMPA